MRVDSGSGDASAEAQGGYAEDELLPLSGLQHLLYCERRAALVHLEGIWDDNRFTVEGAHLHRGVHETAPRVESRGEVRTERGVPVRSLRLGLIGVADVVEFRRGQSGADSPCGVPCPVEYKLGHRRHADYYEAQLCAQALCLEEMLAVPVAVGAIYYAASRERIAVVFDQRLRQRTEAAAARFHEIVGKRLLPRVPRAAPCQGCSLIESCLPAAQKRGRSARRYLARGLVEEP
ncbi:MAG: CRISPR-associated protein Cas4 [Candidatus Schekmanbacteria bacterium]|nr:CRISPR-associated protein Cas4 [Candidatus Schekmanbacteria bacterium]